MQNAQPNGSSSANRQQHPNSHPARPPPPSTAQLQHRPAVTQQNPQQQQQHQQHQQQGSSSLSSAVSTSASAAAGAATTAAAPKKRTHTGAPKKQKIKGNKAEGAEKKPQCNGLEPCVSCKAASIPCRYDSLSVSKKAAHDAFVLLKKQEHTQKLKNADIIVARMGQLDIAGSNNNFGPILSQVINLPRYEPPPFDFQSDSNRIQSIGHAEKTIIDCYFNHFNYYIPVLNRKAFMDQVSDPVQLLTIEVQKLLTCVLATGFAFRHEIGDQDVIAKMEPKFGVSMCRKFNYFNTQDFLNSSVTNCQCYLILTGFYSSVANYDAVHNLVALSHSASAGLGLNRVKGYYYQYNAHTAESTELGHRIFWCVVIVCSSYSLSHQSPFITANDYDIPFPSRQVSDQCHDFRGSPQDDYEGIKDLEHFVPMYEICSRVADITCTATRQRPHTKVDEVREAMHEWRTKTLPTYLRVTPTDMDAMRSQSRFSKLYHAVAYMFEISLHHTFQLHESHREMGVHGIWSSYCYDAAIGIKNIYNTRPMTRMNAHVILPVAAGAFANIVASKVLGKEETAQRYCDEIKQMLHDIVRASSSMERPQLLGFVAHGYEGVTKLTAEKVEPFKVDAPTSPPRNERSPGFTSESSPGVSTDVTGYSEGESSGEEEEEEEQQQSDYDDDDGQASDQDDVETQDMRMAGQFVPSNNQQGFTLQQQQQQQQLQQQQHVNAQQQHQHPQQRPHPSMTTPRTNSASSFQGNARFPPQQQQHNQQYQQSQPQSPHDASVKRSQYPVVDGNYMASGYNDVVSPLDQTSAPIGSIPMSGTSGASLHHNNASFTGRPHLPHRASDAPLPNFSTDGGKTTADSGFAGSGYAVSGPDQDTYFAPLTNHNSRHRHLSSFSSGQQQWNDNLAYQASSTTGFPNAGGMEDQDGSDPTAIYDQFGNWKQGLNDAQRSKLGEYEALLINNKFTEQEVQNLEIEIHQQLIALGSGIHLSSSHGGGLADYGNQEIYSQSQSQSQSQGQSHAQNPPARMTLQESQLLSGGGFEGFGMVPGLPVTIGDMTFSAEDFVQDGHPPSYPPLLISSTASMTSKSFSEPSDLASPLSAGSNPHHQLLSNYAPVDHPFTTSTKQHGVLTPMNAAMAFAGGNDFGGQELLMYSTLAAGGGGGSGGHDGSTVLAVGPGYGPMDTTSQSTMLFGGIGGGHGGATASATSTFVSGGGAGGRESLMDYMNDPDIMLKGQIFSQVTSNSLQQQQQQQQQQQSHQDSNRRPVVYHQQSR
ncbi:hypothetical protein KI688_003832 [Linnemannia hyalina]|uniref:Xylanolytic transcriptional activator regulatory domain-containing protein n=1 Tax=Linnemannia hyalina TaxID=64524 RepID=A0A9P7XQ87_9FUNG|nr:hypothetical protein KI688_003832 [Linnemannia hyalina]